MEHPLDINRKASHTFVVRAKQFLNFPRSLMECDIQKCDPKLYANRKGAAARKRAKKGLVIIRRLNRDLDKLIKLLK